MNLLEDNVKKLYFHYLFPAFGSTIVMSIYSTVDLVAVGHACGPDGNAALSCVNPLWAIMISLGLLLGVGGSVCMSNMRGAGDLAAADRYFTVSLLCAGILSALVTAGCLIFQEPLLRFFGADDQLLPLAKAYSRWILIAAPFFLIQTALLSFVRNDGAPMLCTVSVICGGVLNMIGDYVLVFPLQMGISGAGLATASGQVLATIVLCSYFLRKSCRLRLRALQRSLHHIRRMLVAGFASFAVDLSFGVLAILFNRQIMRLAGATELAVYGTVSTVAILFQSLFYSVGSALQPIAATNYGAAKHSRVHQVLRLSLITAVLMSLLFTAVSELFPQWWLRLYMEVNAEVLRIGPPALRVYAISFLAMGVNVVATYYLQAVLEAGSSTIITFTRGFVLCALLVYLLPPLFGFSAIWWVMPLAEAVALVLSVLFLRRQLRRTALDGSLPA